MTTVVNTTTGVVTDLPSVEEARRLTTEALNEFGSAAAHHARGWELVTEAITSGAYLALDYRSPGDYLHTEFDGVLAGLDVATRRVAARELQTLQISTRDAAAVLGVSHMTVARDRDAAGVTGVTPAAEPPALDMATTLAMAQYPFTCGLANCWHTPVCERVIPNAAKATVSDETTQTPVPSSEGKAGEGAGQTPESESVEGVAADSFGDGSTGTPAPDVAASAPTTSSRPPDTLGHDGKTYPGKKQAKARPGKQAEHILNMIELHLGKAAREVDNLTSAQINRVRPKSGLWLEGEFGRSLEKLARLNSDLSEKPPKVAATEAVKSARDAMSVGVEYALSNAVPVPEIVTAITTARLRFEAKNGDRDPALLDMFRANMFDNLARYVLSPDATEKYRDQWDEHFKPLTTVETTEVLDAIAHVGGDAEETA